MGVHVSPVQDLMVLRLVEMGFSYEAIDTSRGNKRVGVSLCAPCKIGVKSALDLELEDMEMDENMGKIVALLEYTKEQSLALLKDKYQTDEYLDGFLAAVLDEYTAQGVAQRLGIAVTRMAMEMNISVIVCLCTSIYSAKSVQKLGLELIYNLRYDEYLKDGVPVFKPKPPHDMVRVLVKDLRVIKNKL